MYVIVYNSRIHLSYIRNVIMCKKNVKEKENLFFVHNFSAKDELGKDEDDNFSVAVDIEGVLNALSKAGLKSSGKLPLTQTV